MIQDICYLFSKSVTDKDAELIYNYIDEFTKNEKERFDKILKDLIEMRFKTTHNAIILTLKIYKDTNIKTFPFIQKEARKGYSTKDGTFAFSMYLLNNSNNYLNSYEPVKSLLSKDKKIVYDINNYKDVIISEAKIIMELKLNDLLFSVKSDLDSYLYTGNEVFLINAKCNYSKYKKRSGKRIIEQLEKEI